MQQKFKIFTILSFIFLGSTMFLNAAHIKQVYIEIILTEKGNTKVFVEYELQLDPSSEQELTFKILCHEGQRPKKIDGLWLDESLKVTIKETRDVLMKGTIDISSLTPSDTLASVSLAYELPNQFLETKIWETIIPVLLLDAKPPKAEANVFEIGFSCPTSWKIAEMFPIADINKRSSDDDGSYSMDLQVIPSWLSFKLYQGDSPPRSLTFLVDLLVVGLLIVGGFVAWRGLKG